MSDADDSILPSVITFKFRYAEEDGYAIAIYRQFEEAEKMGKLSRVARKDLGRYGEFLLTQIERQGYVSTLKIWVDAAHVRGLPVTTAEMSMQPSVFRDGGMTTVMTQETPGSYAPAWLVYLWEVVSPQTGVLRTSTWDRIVDRKGALHSAWMLGGHITMMQVFRAGSERPPAKTKRLRSPCEMTHGKSWKR